MTTSDLIRELDSAIDAMRDGDGSLRPSPKARPGQAATRSNGTAATGDLMDDGHRAHDPAELAELLSLAARLDEVRLPSPSREFQARLARQIALAPTPSSLQPAGPTSALSGLRRLLQRQARLATGALAALAVFLAVGAVNASADALPGEPLYPVKRGVESIRLLLADDERRMGIHLELARLRLDEALASPAYSGALLAEFSGEVTSALVAGDAAIASGVPRDEVARPLLNWLLQARRHLIENREVMPPTAWRAALALVDEAIRALRDGQALSGWPSGWPVPRLSSARDVLGEWAASLPWDRPAGGGLDDGREARDVPLAQIGGDASDPSEGGGPVDPDRTGLSADRSTGSRQPRVPGRTGAGQGPSSPAAATVVPTPDTQSNPGNVPRPTDTEQPPASPTRREPSATVDPTTAVPAPATETSTSELPTSTPTEADTPIPTPSPTASPTTGPAAPVIDVAYCSPNPVLAGNTAKCYVSVTDLDTPIEELVFDWTADIGSMTHADEQSAEYHANVVGSTEMKTWITVVVTDPGGLTAESRFEMRILAGSGQVH